jgi:hypothetical protein
MDFLTIVRGIDDPQVQRAIFDYDPQRGWTTITEVEGASQAKINALAQQYVANGIACRVVLEKDKGSIEAHDSTINFVLDVWQVLGNRESRDVLSHPTVLSLATNDQVAAMRAGINNLSIGTGTVSGAVANIFTSYPALAGLPAPSVAILSRFIGLVLRGSTDYFASQYVIRHTTNVPARWQTNVADINVGSIYTRPSLIAEATNPNLWILPMPARLVYKIQQIPAPTPQAFYQWGFLKDPSTEITAASNRIDISQEYTLEQWSTDSYPNVV